LTTALLHAIAAQRPLLLILEDLHWADASSISLLFHCCRHLSGHPICLLVAYRHNSATVSREGQPHPLLGVMAELKRQYGDIWLDLAAVDAVQGRHFVDAYLDAQAGARLAQSFRQALFAHTGGHPLFTVELVQDLQARGYLQRTPGGDWVEARAIDWEELPAKVEGVIEQRLNDLAANLRQALTIASVEGETFTAEVVAHVQGSPALVLVQQLSSAVDRQPHLIGAQALEWTGTQRLSRYRFRHYLFQRYLYQQMDAHERAYLHEAVGLAMEKLYGDQAAAIAVPLARHFQATGRAEKAIHYLQIAAQAAVRKSAYTEGINHLRLALDLLAQLPPTDARDQQELTLQLALGQAFIAVKGYGAPDVAQAFTRARELCGQISALPQRFPILYGLYTYYFTRAEHHTARELAEQMWTLAQAQSESGYLLLAQRALGMTALQMGELAFARQHLTQVITLYDPQRHHEWV
jgi:predicted ATPase